MVLKQTKKGKEKKQSDPSPDGAENQKDNKINDPENQGDQIPSDEGETKETANETQDLEAQLTAEKEKLLRVSAEFENYKKRKQRETDDFKKFANENIFKRMLTVVDNLERAISSAEDSADDTSLLEGVKLTHKDILNLFEAFSVTQVEAENQPFDPNFHQAVTQEETDEVPENTVTTVLQKGYLLHDRLIRPAMVVVSKKVQKETEKSEEK
ncbi:MAG TPA: nucleotide exchange factor GrpE [Desulfobacteraceae bacterium]|nr:nucleotide exchange factor GrpE [Desulfobacteraceae bacterium]